MAGKKAKIYADFFANCAVAWFTAGVVAPVFTRPTEFSALLPSIIAVPLTIGFLRIAGYLVSKTK